MGGGGGVWGCVGVCAFWLFKSMSLYYCYIHKIRFYYFKFARRRAHILTGWFTEYSLHTFKHAQTRSGNYFFNTSHTYLTLVYTYTHPNVTFTHTQIHTNMYTHTHTLAIALTHTRILTHTHIITSISLIHTHTQKRNSNSYTHTHLDTPPRVFAHASRDSRQRIDSLNLQIT